jgi:hypothetical protein
MARLPDPEREAARERGDKRYISAKPCPHGHVGERFVISTACCVCADITRAKRSGQSFLRSLAKRKPEPEPEPEPVAEVRFRRSAFSRMLMEYHSSQEGRARSRYLNRLIRDLTAIKEVPRYDEENA